MKRIALLACMFLALAGTLPAPATAQRSSSSFSTRSYSAPRTYTAPRTTITPRSYTPPINRAPSTSRMTNPAPRSSAPNRFSFFNLRPRATPPKSLFPPPPYRPVVTTAPSTSYQRYNNYSSSNGFANFWPWMFLWQSTQNDQTVTASQLADQATGESEVTADRTAGLSSLGWLVIFAVALAALGLMIWMFSRVWRNGRW